MTPAGCLPAAGDNIINVMPDPSSHTFSKQERMTSRKLMEQLFAGGHRSMAAFPVRAVFMEMPADSKMAPVQVLVSVSKRHFKRAVKRNRAKRQVREAFRQNKHIICDALRERPGTALAIAFLWLSDSLHDSRTVDASVASLLRRMAEKL